MKKVFLLLTVICAGSAFSYGRTVNNIELKPKGVYKGISIKNDNQLIKQLSTGYEANKVLIDSIKNDPNHHIPPVLYTMAVILFNADKKDDACYWYYLAQLRTRYDFNRCADKTTSGSVAQWNMMGADINPYALKNVDNLKLVIDKVVAFVRNNNEEYDQRWLNLEGMGAFDASLGGSKKSKLSLPESEWPAIKKKTIDDYYQGFTEFVLSKQAKKQ